MNRGFLNKDILIWLVIASSILIVLALINYLWKKKNLQAFFRTKENPFKLVQNLSIVKSRLALISWIVLWLMTCVAYLRPFNGVQEFEKATQKYDLLIVLDISKSMDTKDVVYGSRLAYSKWWIKKLLFSLPSNRVGLVSFSGISYLECPLTIDRTNLFSILESLNTSHLPFGGTNIQLALQEAYKVLSQRNTSNSYKSVLLISDGGQLQGDYSQIIDKFKKDNIKVDVFGVGNKNKSTPIQDASSKYVRDKFGNIVKSRLESTTLQDIAQKTNSFYFEYEPNNLLQTGHQKYLNQLFLGKKNIDEKQKFTKYNEIYTYFVIIALVCAFLFFILSNRRGVLLLLLLFYFVPIVEAQNQISSLKPKQGEKVDKFDQEFQAISNQKEKFNFILKKLKNNPIKLIDKLEKLQKKGEDEQVLGAINYNLGTLNLGQANTILQQGFEQNPRKAVELLKKADSFYKKSNNYQSHRRNISALNFVEKKQALAKQYLKKKKKLEDYLKQASTQTLRALQVTKKHQQDKNNNFTNSLNQTTLASQKIFQLVDYAKESKSKSIKQFDQALNLVNQAIDDIKQFQDDKLKTAIEKLKKAYDILNPKQQDQDKQEQNQDDKSEESNKDEQDNQNQDKKTQQDQDKQEQNQDDKSEESNKDEQDNQNQDKKTQQDQDKQQQNQDEQGKQANKDQQQQNQDEQGKQANKDQQQQNQDDKSKQANKDKQKEKAGKSDELSNDEKQSEKLKKSGFAESEIKAILQKAQLKEKSLRELFLQQRSKRQKKNGDLNW